MTVNAQTLYTELSQNGVILWLAQDKVCYRATKGSLKPFQLEYLKQYKPELASLLHRKNEQEYQKVKAAYQACLNVRKSSDYRYFDALTLRCEREAFERMERRMLELEKAISESRRLQNEQS